MPIFESPSYHGYDTIDYETIEKDYGTNADFQRFLDEAHKRGIRVIVDFVMNHTSSEHPWFIDSASSPTSSKRDWYVWGATNPGWTQPWGGNFPTWYLKNGAYYYGVFWSGMPDLNYRNPEVKAEMFRHRARLADAGRRRFPSRRDALSRRDRTGRGTGRHAGDASGAQRARGRRAADEARCDARRREHRPTRKRWRRTSARPPRSAAATRCR